MELLIKSTLALLLTSTLAGPLAVQGDDQTNAFYTCIAPNFPEGYCATKLAPDSQKKVYYDVRRANRYFDKPFHFDCLGSNKENRYCCRRELREINDPPPGKFIVAQDEFEHGRPYDNVPPDYVNCYAAPADS
ncbi:uncharacterized protein PGTG_11355 [Puccinia graminis f. sp. tritici CRL 75-36-700-3]|uniref:Uncharacterized protein n=1 Tax=Puccinia graminis f. sp. tritici (strain CRL 75-36-700-3 / race SCCL) TaxID=418459 RepID=E3KLL1_PUCGT|nr:uncharacterized protein PGTG_11355 [Puccinia graminis f. sp. tritici CRL 75-36-700-3]EFP85186.1 hypothetical protein PGTG_11355 [Puccinia graminis f. sp. tritici CRL 75-36-700-3]